jgi:hypothetical protein
VWTFLLGLNDYTPMGAPAGHRIAVEMSRSVLQDPSGPQLEIGRILTSGWRESFCGKKTFCVF